MALKQAKTAIPLEAVEEFKPMKLVCIVKYVPDVDGFQYDYDNNSLNREKRRLILNPDDVCAVAFALKVKEKYPHTKIHVLTMAPASVTPHMEDLLRLGVNKATILSDELFAGSDTYVTSKVLTKYLTSLDMDCLLSGTHAIDGDTSHIPSQLAECLGFNQMSNIISIDIDSFLSKAAIFDVEGELDITTYEMDFPAILSLSRESLYKLPYPKRADLDKDISPQLQIITNRELGFKADEVGLKGSPTKVSATYKKTFNKKAAQVVGIDDKGIEFVYQFLKDKGCV